MGGSAALGDSAKLAWWDVADFKIPMIQAQIEDGPWVNVPVSFFLSHSYAASHGYFDQAKTEGHYFPTYWGSASDYSRVLSSGTCPTPPPIADPELAQDRLKRLSLVGTFLRAHHRKMLKRIANFGRYSFYLRLHHHPSNPWMYKAFNKMDVRKIDRYRLLTQSVCLSLRKGKLVEHVVKEDSVVFDVQ